MEDVWKVNCEKVGLPRLANLKEHERKYLKIWGNPDIDFDFFTFYDEKYQRADGMQRLEDSNVSQVHEIIEARLAAAEKEMAALKEMAEQNAEAAQTEFASKACALGLISIAEDLTAWNIAHPLPGNPYIRWLDTAFNAAAVGMEERWWDTLAAWYLKIWELDLKQKEKKEEEEEHRGRSRTR